MRHYNYQISKRLSDLFKVKGESMPQEVYEEIVPVMNVERESDVIVYDQAVNSTSQTLMTTDTDKDFYITSIILGSFQDGTATNTLASVSAVIGGKTVELVSIPRITLIAINNSSSVVFTPRVPIKVDRGGAIRVKNTTAVANVRSYAHVYGYYVE